MSLSALLLRVLLCVSLIANGVGFAQASTRMQLAHASHRAHDVAGPGADGASVQCHPGMTMASHGGEAMPAMDHAAMGHGVSDANDASPATDQAPDEPADCCDGKTCQCACTQHASAGFIPEVSPGAMPAHSAIAMGGNSQHASPRLPHLIRPPIG